MSGEPDQETTAATQVLPEWLSDLVATAEPLRKNNEDCFNRMVDKWSREVDRLTPAPKVKKIGGRELRFGGWRTLPIPFPTNRRLAVEEDYAIVAAMVVYGQNVDIADGAEPGEDPPCNLDRLAVRFGSLFLDDPEVSPLSREALAGCVERVKTDMASRSKRNRTLPGGGVPQTETASKVRRWLKSNVPCKIAEAGVTIRMIADAIGSSVGAVQKCQPWKAFHAKRKQDKKSRQTGLTDEIVEDASEKQSDELRRLVDEQRADDEPSPQKDHGRSPRVHHN
jgi:hypothetical protein